MEKVLREVQRYPPTCWFTRTRGPFLASTAGSGFTRSQTWRNTLTYTQVNTIIVIYQQMHGYSKSLAQHPSLLAEKILMYIAPIFNFQEKSPTNASFATSPSANPRTWSLTWGSTVATSPSPADSATRSSRGRSTSGGTERPSTPMNPLTSLIVRPWPRAMPWNRPTQVPCWH